MKRSLTTQEQERCFKLMDDYARSKHNCYVAEFFLSTRSGAYNVCFRPVGTDNSNRYSCKYVELDVEDARAAVEAHCLPSNAADMLDQTLSKLPHRP